MREGQHDDGRYLTRRENRDGPTTPVIPFHYETVTADAQEAPIIASVAVGPHFAKFAAVRGDF